MSAGWEAESEADGSEGCEEESLGWGADGLDGSEVPDSSAGWEAELVGCHADGSDGWEESVGWEDPESSAGWEESGIHSLRQFVAAAQLQQLASSRMMASHSPGSFWHLLKHSCMQARHAEELRYPS